MHQNRLSSESERRIAAGGQIGTMELCDITAVEWSFRCDHFHSWRHQSGNPRLENSNAHLTSYSGHRLTLLIDQKTEVKVLYGAVVKTIHNNQLGRDWLQTLKFNWPEMFANNIVEAKSTNARLDVLLYKYHEVFRVELGHFQGIKAQIDFKPHVLYSQNSSSRNSSRMPGKGKQVTIWIDWNELKFWKE